MDQASAWLAASCARNPAVPKTSPSWRLSEDQSQIVVPPRDGLAPQSEPHSEPVHIAPRPSSPALCQSNAKGYLLPGFYSGCATGIPGRFSEGLLLRRVQPKPRQPRQTCRDRELTHSTHFSPLRVRVPLQTSPRTRGGHLRRYP